MIKLYGYELSGNSYKAKLMLSLLGLEYEWIKVDLLAGAHKQPEFLALNPFGQVPVLVDENIVIPDAQAFSFTWAGSMVVNPGCQQRLHR